MLKSTHKPAAPPAPLPPGWIEHKAPTGHPYYYHASTKTSTYTRPTDASGNESYDSATPAAVENHDPVRATSGPLLNYGGYNGGYSTALGAPPSFSQQGSFGGRRGPPHQRRPVPEDRPKSKHTIPGCAPWLLVKTKLERRFVYNPDEGLSLWRFPPDVLKCVIEMDRVEREKRERRERGISTEPEDKRIVAIASSIEATPALVEAPPKSATVDGTTKVYSSDEYEEVEVTDDEDENHPSKKQKMDDEPQGPIEFNEDDIAYQLAALGHEDQEGYDRIEDDDNVAWVADAALTEEDSVTLFRDLLDDFHINPYTPWETVIGEGKIIEDDRYTVLPTMKSRKEAWDVWTRDRIQQLKTQKEQQEKKDPRIPYLTFLQKYATPKLYWPEFRRKYKKEAEMRDTKLADKDREKWYREHINRLKLSESTLKSDLSALLKSLPLHETNRWTSMEALPSTLLRDIRYISLRPAIRDPLIEAYIDIQPAVLEQSDVSPLEEAERVRLKLERSHREKALAEREKKVLDEKKKQHGALQHSKGMLQEGEEQVRRAMQVGKEGLLGHLQNEPQQDSAS